MEEVTALSATKLWIRRFHEADERSPVLVCFPHAGGAAGSYFPLSRALAPSLEVWAVQYPGRQDRRHEPLIGDIPTLADRAAGHVLAALARRPGRPAAFFGHSMGASVAFEVARRLRDHGNPRPGHLFLSGRRAPDRYREESVHLGDDRALLAEMRALGGTDPAVFTSADLVRLLLPALRADYRAIETYRYTPGPPLDCPISVLVGDRDPKTTLDEAAAWAAHTTGPCTVKVLPGGHFPLTDNAAEVIELIRAAAG